MKRFLYILAFVDKNTHEIRFEKTWVGADNEEVAYCEGAKRLLPHRKTTEFCNDYLIEANGVRQHVEV